ncbi:MAG: UDP-N-acetylmuramate dehydrogenase, partial [Actinomycetota bacterium]|nr:UDP-N-acetylmuramate dehydrogenase [Actinomycetota bacterium]
MDHLTGVSLADRTTLRLGGPAAELVVARTESELVETVTEADAQRQSVLILGGGSNVVVADEGFPGLVVVVATQGVERTAAPDGRVLVSAQAGVEWDDLVAEVTNDGLAGVEALSGIPGLVGATPIQNVGAYGQEVADTVTEVRVLDRPTGRVTTMTPRDIGFTYRGSVFKGGADHVVLGVTYALTPGGVGAPVRYAELAAAVGVDVGETAPVLDVREAVLALRRRKGMVLDPQDHDTWSAGSFFTNPVLTAEAAAALPAAAPRWPAPDGRVKVSAAWLIEQAGFSRGYGDGPVRLSGKHTLALTNRGAARTADLLALAR